MKTIATAVLCTAVWVKHAVALACLTAILIYPAAPAAAQSTPVMRKGDAAVTSFSGALALAAPPAGSHPLDTTLLDPSKPTLQVFDLSKLGGPPRNQLARAPVRFEAKAVDIGHVFAVAVDTPMAPVPPNIYAAATSMFGLQIVDASSGGKLTRLVKGSARAQWMPGQFGLDKGGGPGSIWKIDGATGLISLFANITSGTVENAGPGIGGVAIDDLTGHLFATNLETGLIHRLDQTGRELDTFDHGVTARAAAGLPSVADDPSKRMDIKTPAFNIEEPTTWGYANSKRRTIALAVANGRLYYSVAEGPVIWSVGLNVDSSFIDDARLEIDITNTPNGNPVTGIVFDGAATMYVSQRGESTGSYDFSTFARPQLSVVSRYTFDIKAAAWKETPEEVAIGMEPVHRATNGGIALNYGYDANGNIDLAKCRQSLWTTGEHLRAGQAGQAIVHGLQGSDKNHVQVPSTSPARSGSTALQGDFTGKVPDAGLTPPKDVWFTDNDGMFEDAQAHAHIGAIAIYNPCDQVASAPRPAEPPYVPGTPRPRAGIYIDKVCAPALFGSKTRCDVTLTNVGTSPLWAISLTDTGTVLSGAGAGTPLVIDSVTPDGLEFVCSPVPSTAVSCSLPPAALPPGATRKVSMLIDTDPIFSAGNDGYENCATLGNPYWGQACFRSKGGPSGGGLVLKKTAPAVCLQNGPCTYSLTVTNTGGLAFNGAVLISDGMLLNGVVPSPAPITSIAPPMGCAGGEPVALPIQCTTNLTLAPGGSKSFDVTITMPAGDFWAHNCFAVTAPGVPPGDLSVVGACAWTRVGNPLPLANLMLKKTAGACGKSGPDTVRCNYAVSLTNTGPSPFNAPVAITETVSATATMGSLDATWGCAGAAPNFACNSAGNVTLAPGASTSFPVFVDTPRIDIEANTCLAPNTVSVLLPVGGDTNFDASDDTATAIGDSALLEFFDPITGLTTVICDPTNLRTTKVPVSDCAKTGAGYECGYKVTITNMGPDPYKGPVNLKDELEGASSVTASGDGWACADGGSIIQCSKPPLTLAKGASLELSVRATVPETGQCSARNTATMTFPPAGTRFNLSGADDSATATAAIASPKCLERPACKQAGPGEFVTASGTCACQTGSTRDKNRRCLSDTAPQPAAKTCPDGYPVPQNGLCPCPTGSAWNKLARVCEVPCQPGANEYLTSAGQCVCKDGFERSAGRCVPERDEDRCELGPNELRTPRGRCVCKDGFERDTRGRCVAELNPADECGRVGRVWTGKRCIDPPRPQDKCVASGGSWRGGTCHYGPTDQEKCEARGGRYVKGDCVIPQKQCPDGFIGKYPNCTKPPKQEKSCPEGTFGKPPVCIPIKKPKCPKGTFGNYPNCKAVNDTPQPPTKCPPGTAGRPPNCKPKTEGPSKTPDKVRPEKLSPKESGRLDPKTLQKLKVARP